MRSLGYCARTPGAAIRLERPIEVPGQRIHVDLLVSHADRTIAIELKYKTRALSTIIDDEHFDLTGHSAQDQGRYDFLADVGRIENLASACDDTTGYAILLTNDSAYWKLPRTDHTVDASFRIHEARRLQGSLAWSDKASAGTKRGRGEPLMLLGAYVMTWKDYSEPCDHAYGQFRWLLAQVGPDRQRVAL